MVDKKPQSGFTLYAGGCEGQGEEQMGRELGVLLEKDIPAFLVDLGRKVAESGKDFYAWYAANPQGIDETAAPYLG